VVRPLVVHDVPTPLRATGVGGWKKGDAAQISCSHITWLQSSQNGRGRPGSSRKCHHRANRNLCRCSARHEAGGKHSGGIFPYAKNSPKLCSATLKSSPPASLSGSLVLQRLPDLGGCTRGAPGVILTLEQLQTSCAVSSLQRRRR
jgi:hypothetical protein